jgi:hypothetical protein
VANVLSESFEGLKFGSLPLGARIGAHIADSALYTRLKRFVTTMTKTIQRQEAVDSIEGSRLGHKTRAGIGAKGLWQPIAGRGWWDIQSECVRT